MVNPKRIRQITDASYEGGTVVYEMCRELRAHDNDALLFAQQLALSKGAQLIVNYTVYNYLWVGATARFYDWVFASLQEVENILRTHNIPLIITISDGNIFAKSSTITILQKLHETIGAMVIEEIPLHFARRWKELYMKHNGSIPLYEVDAHNCIPVWELSPKQEFAARTIRSKVHAKLSPFLEEYETLIKHEANSNLLRDFPEIDWVKVRQSIICNEDVQPVTWILPGEKYATSMLRSFITKKLTSYDESRNNINIDGQSNLSPYIAHGNISRRRIIVELLKETKISIENAFDPIQNGSNGTLGSIAAFIEECVIRAELSENFCFYNTNYSNVGGFPEWAKKVLAQTGSDTREYIYTKKQLEFAETHDELWNAAQRQMTRTGKMHGYMRMYWAKKLLEWTKNPEDAMSIAIYLNDTYELDGRDPNGYVGCAWSIGGLHDRPWFNRPIFGTIRYMARSGVEKRGNIQEYINTFSKQAKLL